MVSPKKQYQGAATCEAPWVRFTIDEKAKQNLCSASAAEFEVPKVGAELVDWL